MTLTLPDQPIPDERLTPAKVAEIHITAADLLALEGLCRGDWWELDRTHPYTWTPGHRLCAVGALAVASGYRTDAQMLREFTALYCPPTNPGQDPPEPGDPHPALRALLDWHDTQDIEYLFRWSDDAKAANEPERITGTFRAIAAGLRAQSGTSS